MKHITFLLLQIVLLSFFSCTEDRFIEAEPQMVVEGWINEGDNPVVMLSQIIPATEEEISTENLKDYIIVWGKVTISDGEKEVVLTGMKSDEHFPPYIYTTSKMRGEAGKTYRLTAEYKNFRATATTTIPPKVKLDTIITDNENEKYNINAVISDNPNEKNYYKFFVKVEGRDSCYLSSNLAVVDDKHFTFPYKIPIDIGYSIMYDNSNYYYKISEKDKIYIKFAQIDSVAYNFWDDYKNMLELGQNIFFKYSTSLRSNISGGLGYWIGYGATEYLLEPYNHNNPVELKR